MLQPKNDFKKNIIVVLLCAGEGLRLKEITSNIPKPLIKIKTLDGISILEHTIINLIKLGIESIYVITGHLGHKIEQFLTSFKNDNKDFEEKVFLIDSEGQYKLGPLYSFLSIANNDTLFRRQCVYFVMPGDTIFHFKLLNQLVTFILNNFKEFQDIPATFYRKITVNVLKKKLNLQKISTTNIEKKSSQYILKKLEKTDLQPLSEMDFVRQTIPFFFFPYSFLINLLNHVKNVQVHTITEVINDLIEKGNNVIAVKISNEYHFYDIDTISDIHNFDGFHVNKKKEGDNSNNDN